MTCRLFVWICVRSSYSTRENAFFPSTGDERVWVEVAQIRSLDLANFLLAKEEKRVNTPRSHIRAVRKASDGGFVEIFQSFLVDTEGTDVNGVLAKS